MAIGTPVPIGTANVALGTATITVGAGGAPAGSTVFVAIGCNEGSVITSVTDSKSNTYVQDAAETTQVIGNTDTYLYRASNITALVNLDTITITRSAGSVLTTTAAYATGLATSNPLDQSNNGTAASTTVDSGNITTTQAAELIIGVVTVENGDADGFTQDPDYNSNFTQPVTGQQRTLRVGDRIVSATETNNYAPTLGTSRSHAEVIASYVQAAAGDSIGGGSAELHVGLGLAL